MRPEPPRNEPGNVVLVEADVHGGMEVSDAKRIRALKVENALQRGTGFKFRTLPHVRLNGFCHKNQNNLKMPMQTFEDGRALCQKYVFDNSEEGEKPFKIC